MFSQQSTYTFFFFNDTATTEIYTLSLHDALPICDQVSLARDDSPGIHHFESLSPPVRRSVNAVASHAGFIPHERAPAAANPVEQSGLADVRPSEDDDAGELYHLKRAGALHFGRLAELWPVRTLQGSMLFFQAENQKAKGEANWKALNDSNRRPQEGAQVNLDLPLRESHASFGISELI